MVYQYVRQLISRLIPRPNKDTGSTASIIIWEVFNDIGSYLELITIDPVVDASIFWLLVGIRLGLWMASDTGQQTIDRVSELSENALYLMGLKRAEEQGIQLEEKANTDNVADNVDIKKKEEQQ